MIEAKARIGKRVRLRKSRDKVLQGTTGTVIRVRREGAGGRPMSSRSGEKNPEPTIEVWILDIKCDNPLKTILSFDERDECLEKI
jgi:hypothetical protein